jgi:hypothetical protein
MSPRPMGHGPKPHQKIAYAVASYANFMTEVTRFPSHGRSFCGKKRLLLFVLAPLAFVQ